VAQRSAACERSYDCHKSVRSCVDRGRPTLVICHGQHAAHSRRAAHRGIYEKATGQSIDTPSRSTRGTRRDWHAAFWYPPPRQHFRKGAGLVR